MVSIQVGEVAVRSLSIYSNARLYGDRAGGRVLVFYNKSPFDANIKGAFSETSIGVNTSGIVPILLHEQWLRIHTSFGTVYLKVIGAFG